MPTLFIDINNTESKLIVEMIFILTIHSYLVYGLDFYQVWGQGYLTLLPMLMQNLAVNIHANLVKDIQEGSETSNSMFGLCVMLACCALGCTLQLAQILVSPLLLAFILSNDLEGYFRKVLIMQMEITPCF